MPNTEGRVASIAAGGTNMGVAEGVGVISVVSGWCVRVKEWSCCRFVGEGELFLGFGRLLLAAL